MSRFNLFSQLSGVGILHLCCGIYLRHEIVLQALTLAHTLTVDVEIEADVAITAPCFADANRLFQLDFCLFASHFFNFISDVDIC